MWVVNRVEDGLGQLRSTEHQPPPHVLDADIQMQSKGLLRVALDLGQGPSPGMHRQTLDIGHPLAGLGIEFQGCVVGLHGCSHPFPRQRSRSRPILASVPAGMSPVCTAIVVTHSPQRTVR